MDLILGSHSRIESGGEVRRFWEYFSDNSPRPKEERLCTCGVHANECEYWARVRSRLNEKYGMNLESDDRKKFEKDNYNLIQAILQVSGKEVFCDSSKSYPRLQRLLYSDLFTVYLVHLVRDGRAVAFSLKRKGELQGIQKQWYNYYEALGHWQGVNTRCYSEFKDYAHYILVKYEDLVDDPQKQISRILEQVSQKFESDQLRFWQFDHHNIGGNLMRVRGEQEIREDRRYIESLSSREWWFGTISAWSGLKRFGYSMRRG